MRKRRVNNPYKRVKINGRSYHVHRLVWEEANGPIPDGYRLHHINHDQQDNRIENLVLLSGSDHGRIHGGEPRPKNGQWSVRHDACVECGTTERNHYARGMCNRCYQRVRWHQPDGHWPEDRRFGWQL